MDQYIKRYLIESIRSGKEHIRKWNYCLKYDKLPPDEKKEFLTFLFFEFDVYPEQQLIYFKIFEIYRTISSHCYDDIYIEVREKFLFDKNKKLIQEKLSELLFDQDIEDKNFMSYILTRTCSNTNLILELKDRLTHDEICSLIHVLSYISGGNIPYSIEFFYYILALFMLSSSTENISYSVAKMGATNLQYTCIKYIVNKHKDKIRNVSDMLPTEIIDDIHSYISFLKP